MSAQPLRATSSSIHPIAAELILVWTATLGAVTFFAASIAALIPLVLALACILTLQIAISYWWSERRTASFPDTDACGRCGALMYRHSKRGWLPLKAHDSVADHLHAPALTR